MTIRTDVITGPLRTIRTACPVCNKGPRDTALAISPKGCGGFVWFCHRCGMRGASRGDIKGGTHFSPSVEVPCPSERAITTKAKDGQDMAQKPADRAEMHRRSLSAGKRMHSSS